MIVHLELLKLGVASANDDGATVISCRVACRLALLQYRTREELAKTNRQVSQRQHVVCVELPTLITWLYSLDPEADMHFFSALLKLSLFCGEESPAHNHTSPQYTRLKARLVGDAYIEYGDKVLSRHREDDLLFKKIQEKDRLDMQLNH